MTSAALSAITAGSPQIEPANFLNLLIVDDERSIREACREVAQSLGFSAFVADSAEQGYRLLCQIWLSHDIEIEQDKVPLEPLKAEPAQGETR